MAETATPEELEKQGFWTKLLRGLTGGQPAPATPTDLGTGTASKAGKALQGHNKQIEEAD
jgi:hypothetical protein